MLITLIKAIKTNFVMNSFDNYSLSRSNKIQRKPKEKNIQQNVRDENKMK